jgi:hypothetical protein
VATAAAAAAAAWLVSAGPLAHPNIGHKPSITAINVPQTRFILLLVSLLVRSAGLRRSEFGNSARKRWPVLEIGSITRHRGSS